MDPILMQQVTDLPIDVEKKRLYRGKGGQVVRIAVCRFIECLSITKM